MQWIRAIDLEIWSNTHAAQDTLPEVVRRAIWATVPVRAVREINFPAGESVGQPGWDGTLESARETPYVPLGVSAWEFGTGNDPWRKANEDYSKRLAQPLGIDPKRATFVFVTSRRWPDKKAWEEGKRKEQAWANVRALNADDLEQWLEHAPVVGAWLAKALGRFPEGVVSLGDFWDAYRACTNPPATEGLLLAARGEQARLLLDLLTAPAQRIVIRSDSWRESLAFAAAAVEDSGERRRGLIARAILADDATVAQKLGHHTSLIVAIKSGADEIGGFLVARGNHVVVPVGNELPNYEVTLNLARAAGDVFAKALAEMRLPEDEAERLARECGRSVTILQRRRPAAGISLPNWAVDDNARSLIPALLAGAWDESVLGDREVLEGLAGTKYEALAPTLQKWLGVSDPPLRRVRLVWALAAPADAFTLLSRYLAGPDFERLAAAAEMVLAEVDPALDLPAPDRPFAALHDKVFKHSRWLRAGIAEALLLLSVLGKSFGTSSFADPESFVSRFVRALLDEAPDWRRFASLSDQLPTLAEAAPDPFLEVLEKRLERRAADLLGIFSEGGPFASSPHTGLLWALEILAWSPRYLVRVALVLAVLARIDPGGRLANRPQNSLREIFLPWHPNTYAGLDDRLRALDAILRHEPAVGWKLLVQLLPESHAAATTTARPRWRDFGAAGVEPVTIGLYMRATREITARLLDRIGCDPARWQTLIERVHELAPSDRDRALTLLEDFAKRDVPAADRETVWRALVHWINRHRSFEGTEWALKGAELDRWQKVADELVPNDLVQRHLWLFNSHVPDLPTKLGSTRERRKELEARRAGAIREVLSREGVDGLARLVDAAQYPALIAWSFPAMPSDLGLLDQLLDATAGGDERRRYFAATLSARALAVLGQQWRDRLLSRARDEKWRPELVAIALSAWPDEPEVWDAAASFGPDTERSYWSQKFARPIEESQAVLIRAIRKYIEVGRAVDALDVASFRANELPSAVLYEILDSVLIRLSKDDSRSLPGGFQHYVKTAFDALYAAPDADPGEIAKREYAFLPILASPLDEGSLQLHKILSSDPSFFAEVLTHVYKPTSTESQEAADDFARRRAELGYRLLSSWRLVPGTMPDGTIDSGKLIEWIDSARKLAAERDRAKVADHQIGRVLAHAPVDSDGIWPHRAVREALEIVRSWQIEDSMRAEVFNKRGVHWRSPGGDQERELAFRYRTWAEQVGAQSPRTYTVLHRIADMWEAEAKREDERTEQEQLRH